MVRRFCSHEFVNFIIVVLASTLAPVIIVIIVFISSHGVSSEDRFVGEHNEINEIEEAEESDVEEGVRVVLCHPPGVEQEVERGLLVRHIQDGRVRKVRLAPGEHLGQHEHSWSAHVGTEGYPREPHSVHFGHFEVDIVWVWNHVFYEQWRDDHPHRRHEDAWAKNSEPAHVVPGVHECDLPLLLVVLIVLVVAGAVQALAQLASHLALFAISTLASFTFLVVITAHHVII